MLRSVVLSCVCLLAVAGCGSDAAEDAGPQDEVALGKTPPDDPGDPKAAGEATTLAVRTIQLGDIDLDGQPNANAWKTIGYNLDGLLSTPAGKNHCALQKGANPNYTKQDGEDGIDNSFGENLMPILTSVSSDVSPLVNGALSTGDFSILMHLGNLDTPDTQTGIDAALYGGALHKDIGICSDGSNAPCWDGTDVWPVSFESVNGGSIDEPKVAFPKAYMVDGTWVSGSRGDIALVVTVEGYELHLDIRNAFVTMDVTGRGTDAEAVNGVIAGVLVTEELIEDLRSVAGNINPSLCQGSTFEGIAAQIRGSSDIVADGSNGDPGQLCNAISVGLGFQSHGVTLGPVADPIKPGPNPCATAK